MAFYLIYSTGVRYYTSRNPTQVTHLCFTSISGALRSLYVHPCSDTSSVKEGENRPLRVCILCVLKPYPLSIRTTGPIVLVSLPTRVRMAFQELNMPNDSHVVSHAFLRMSLTLKQPLRSPLTILVSPHRLLESLLFPYSYLCVQMIA